MQLWNRISPTQTRGFDFALLKQDLNVYSLLSSENLPSKPVTSTLIQARNLVDSHAIPVSEVVSASLKAMVIIRKEGRQLSADGLIVDGLMGCG